MQAQYQKLLNAINMTKPLLKSSEGYRILSAIPIDEMTLSSLIAHVFDPNQRHGQGSLMMCDFLSLLATKGQSCSETDGNITTKFISDLEFSPDLFAVQTEICVINQRRIDILATFRNGAKLGFENKPWAGDQENQLHDYAVGLNSSNVPWILVYLCNSKPSVWSLPEDSPYRSNIICLDFVTLVEWLKKHSERTKAQCWEFSAYLLGLAKEIDARVNGRSWMLQNLFEVFEEQLKDDETWDALRMLYENQNLYFYSLAQKVFISLSDKLAKQGWVCLDTNKPNIPWDTDLSRKKDFLSIDANGKQYSGVTYRLEDNPDWVARIEFDSSNFQKALIGVIQKDSPSEWSWANSDLGGWRQGSMWIRWKWLPDHLKNWNNPSVFENAELENFLEETMRQIKGIWEIQSDNLKSPKL